MLCCCVALFCFRCGIDEWVVCVVATGRNATMSRQRREDAQCGGEAG